MKYPWLAVGVKVVYLGALNPVFDLGETRPVAGGVYTIREITEGWDGNEICLGVRLIEIVNAPRRYNNGRGGTDFEEKGWNASRFRPVLPDTSKQIEAMRTLMLIAAVRGKVDA